MRIPIIPVLILLITNGFVDYYIYRLLRTRFADKRWSKVQLWSAAALWLILAVMLFLPKRHGDDGAFRILMWSLYGYMTIYASKLGFCIFDWLSLIPRLWHRPRLKILSAVGIGIACIIFGAMWWGALINRFSIRINEIDVVSAQLPEAFDGFRIVHISDLHVGTYGSDTSFMHKMVERINALKPDMVVFTGDIVNRHSSELSPFISTFAQLHASYGVYSILGNHDYGDYYEWPSQMAKQANMDQMYRLQKEMGWHLLRNDYVPIVKNKDTLMVVGVENVGDPPFKIYGDLRKAYPTPDDNHFKILLSHNPAHWTHDIRNNNKANFALTLSGHTHAMQMTIGNFSPCMFRYSTWGGLYDDDNGHQLYVNIGIGTVGMPARIGATPEITLITLLRPH